MRTLSIALLLALSGLALPACSALGLDNLPQADCTRGSGGVTGDAFCASLADMIPPVDSCHTWQCNDQTSHHCEQLPRDDDGDGAPTMMCAAGATPDCNDMDPANHPGGTETCDGLDQNCDGVPDDGVIEHGEMLSSVTTIDPDAHQLLWAVQPDNDEALLVARYAVTYQAVTVPSATMPRALAFSQTGTGAIAPRDSDAAVAPLGGGNYVLGMRRIVTTGCQQWSLFPVGAAPAVTLRATDESLLPACPASGTQDVTALALAGHNNGTNPGQLVLAAWLAGADGARSCGAAPSMTVTVGGASLDARSTAHNRVSTDVLTLGSSVDSGPPVVLAFDDAFLVAYARADKTIAVHLVTVTVDPAGVHVMASPTPDYVEPAGAMVRQGVSLTRGPTTSAGATTVALGYYEGCAGSNPITVRLITRMGTTLTASGTPATGIGTGNGRSRLQIVYQPRASEWLVSWTSGSGLFVQRLFHDGAVEGGPFVVAMSPPPAYVIEPLTAGALYQALTVDGTTVNKTTFGCAPPTPP